METYIRNSQMLKKSIFLPKLGKFDFKHRLLQMYLGIKQVAERLRVSQKVVRRMVAAGNLEFEKSGSAYRVKEESLGNFEVNQDARPVPSTRPKKGKNRIEEDVVNWVDVKNNWDNPGKSNITFVDLFSGAGGITKGFELAGLQGICGLDWFCEAGKTYRRNFSHPFVEGDIRLPKKKEEFYKTVSDTLCGKTLNIVAGGFPCQGFSLAGNRIVDDPRNSLYKELLEIVKTLKPEFVVLENVVGLRSMLGGMVEQMIIEDFEKAGYKLNVTVLRAADYGVPQKRDRVIFMGNRLNLPNYHPKPFMAPEDYITTGEAIADLMELEEDASINHVPTKHREDIKQRIMALPEGKSLYKGYSDAWKKCPWEEPSCTIKENHGGVNIHPKLPRVLTAREMARLQSFPDDFIFEGPKNKQLVQLGNAVPPLLAKAIGLAIRKAKGEI